MASCVTVTVTSSPAQVPNLGITNITSTSLSIVSGTTVTVTATVKNTGTAASGSGWRVMFAVTPPGSPLSSSYSDLQNPLAAGATISVSKSITLTGAQGNWGVCASIV